MTAGSRGVAPPPTAPFPGRTVLLVSPAVRLPVQTHRQGRGADARAGVVLSFPVLTPRRLCVLKSRFIQSVCFIPRHSPVLRYSSVLLRKLTGLGSHHHKAL